MSKCASSSGIEVSVKDVRLSIYLKYSLGRANGTIRKSNVRLTNLTVTGNGRANDQNYQYKYSRPRMCG